jgi:chlorophyll(ide) b reductase
MNQLRQQLKVERIKNKKLNIVITGGSRGLGKTLALEFAKNKDNVCVLSRSKINLDNIKSIQCDVSNKFEITNALSIIQDTYPSIDIWINNAGMSGGYRPIIDLSNQNIENIIKTNLLGTSLCCKEIYNIMSQQKTGGAIFNLAGAGSNGSSTPQYAIYGSTKAAIVQLTKSLQEEWKLSNVDIHLISPGMMVTDLLLDNMNDNTYDAIEFLIKHPEDVSRFLVPRIKRVYYYNQSEYIKFLTIFKILNTYLKYKFSL